MRDTTDRPRPHLRPRHTGWSLCAAVFGLLGLLAPAAAFGTGLTVPLPEVLFVVDTSGSMQFARGADKAPLCGVSSPQKSRWTAVREILGGTWLGYDCQTVSATPHPDTTTPPPQPPGSKQCVPGLDHLATDSMLRIRTSLKTATVSAFSGGTAKLYDDKSDYRVPAFSLDLSSVPTTNDWQTMSVYLSVDTITAGAGADPSVTTNLVLLSGDPAGLGASKPPCAINSMGRQIVSSPVVLDGTSAGKTLTYELQADAVAQLQAARESGTTTFWFGVVPQQNRGNCPGPNFVVAGSDSEWRVDFDTASTGAKAARAVIEVGKQCAGEGPGTHTEISAGTRLFDGMLDVFGGTAKFGFYTMDNVLGATNDTAGGYSYAADTGTLQFGTLNVGLATTGAVGTPSVEVPDDDGLAGRTAAANVIMDALANVQPIGPTTLGQQLQEVDLLFGPSIYQDPHFQSVADDPINGDPWYECRSRMVVVLSDGGANAHFSSSGDGRTEAVAAATSLASKGIPVYVVAVGHPRLPTEAGPADDDLDFLDDLASAGGTGAASRFSTPDAVVDKFRGILGQTILVGQVETNPVYTQSMQNNVDVQSAVHAKSVFDIQDPLRTYGEFDQRVYQCGACASPQNPGQAGVCEVLDLRENLTNRSISRDVQTHRSGAPINFVSGIILPSDLKLPSSGTGAVVSWDSALQRCTVSGLNLADPVKRAQYREHIVALVRGEDGTCREGRPLGAPATSQPAVLVPADELPLREPSFFTYSQAAAPLSPPYSAVNAPGSNGRPTMLFAATHDGLLHAFRLDRGGINPRANGVEAGGEMWAFLPRFNLQRAWQMKLATSPETSFLGGDVVTGHVLLERQPEDLAATAQNWRAVALVGAGEAGAGYLALDVTAPANPHVLWEITPDAHCFGSGVVSGFPGPACVPGTTYDGMGRSTATPVLASLFYDDGSGAAERAVAIIAGGKPPNDTGIINPGTDGAGERVIYVVNMATGELVRELTTADMDKTGMPVAVVDNDDLGYFWTAPRCFDTAPGQVATHCFIGDSKGVLWRMDLSDADPANWGLTYFHDAYGGVGTPASQILPINDSDRVPILTTPAVALARDGSLNIVYGTGSPDEDSTVDRRHIVYSLREDVTVSATGLATGVVAEANWVKTLSAGEEYVGPPIIFDSYAYWASYKTSGVGLCDTGTARIWGVRFERRANPSDESDTIGAFADPSSPADVASNLDFESVGDFLPSPVQVVPVPGCVSGCPPTDPSCVINNGGALSQGMNPQYAVAVSSAGNAQADGMSPSGGGGGPTVGTASTTINAPASAAVITGWDLLLE